MIKAFVFQNLLVLFLGLLSNGKIVACQCIPVTFNEEIEKSNMIFHGRVISVSGGSVFNIKVLKLWKGDSTVKEVQLLQQTGCTRRHFLLEKEYIFYAVNNSVGNCSRTREYDYTIDNELLDRIFHKTVNEVELDSNQLTIRELTVLKNILRRENVWYPENLEQSDIRFVNGDREINKKAFFDYYEWLLFKIQLFKPKEVHNTYFVWTSRNPKSLRKQEKRFMKKYISEK